MLHPAPWRASLALALILLLSACQAAPPAGAPPAGAFFNPLNQLNGPDPWIQHYQGRYYLTATQGSDIRMWAAPTLAGLATAAPVTVWADDTPARCCNVWAPEFHRLDGPAGPRWYLYYSAGTDGSLDNQRMHVLESAGDGPLGPYSYKARIFDPSNDGWAIDGSVLQMPGGGLYYLFSAWDGPEQRLYIAPMSDPWTISGPRVMIARPEHGWERKTGNVNEGPEVLQHNGRTFIIYSASACWGPDYGLGMLSYTGGDPLKPDSWLKHPEPVFGRSDENGVYAPGHNGFFTSPDGKESWIVYHANAGPGDGCVGKRTTRAQPFSWNEDGTPNFGAPLPLDAPIAPPSGEAAAQAPQAPAVEYALVSASDGRCLDGAGAAPGLRPCADGEPGQRWRVGYLGNGHYRLASQAGDAALSVSDGTEHATLSQSAWQHRPEQQWRILTAGAGWLRLQDRPGGRILSCGPDGELQQRVWQSGDSCQQFRLQPLGELRIFSAGSNKPLTVSEPAVALQGGQADGQRWRFAPAADGFFQVVAADTGQCLAGAGPGAQLAPAACADVFGQQWRIEPLNDGTLRLVARDSGQVVDVRDCRMADGTVVQQWSWLDNMCQRLYLAL